MMAVREENFQSPFSGDLDCENDSQALSFITQANFQSPFSGDLDCES